MFDAAFPVAGLRGAEYNPRAITGEAKQMLEASITELGFVKPIIVTRAGLIVAGHQRTNAARALGFTTVPAFVLAEISTTDEVRFNQLHNGTDLDLTDDPVTVPPSATDGYVMVPGEDVKGNTRAVGAVIRGDIMRLLGYYGNWGGAVATRAGRVVSSQQYALSCKILRMPCRVYYIPDALEERALAWFGRSYGAFSYEHLPRKTYVQTLAQMYRLRDGESTKKNRSRLYESMVIRSLVKGERILDFGCGQADYVQMLRKAGHQIFGVEFFHRTGGDIDTTKVHAMIATFAEEMTKRGRFDVVVCDSVLNSVDSTQAEDDVMTCVAAFCRPGGRIYFSGRREERVRMALSHTKSTARRQARGVQFLDANGLTGLYRAGTWFFQKFHTDEQIDALARRYVNPAGAVYGNAAGSWQAGAVKALEPSEADALAAIEREFDLPWPGNKTVGRSALAKAAYLAALAKERG